MKPSTRAATAVLALAASSISATNLRATEAESRDQSAAEKVRAAMQAAVDGAPLIALQESRLGAEVATLRAEAGAGTPVLSWQSEGIGGGFDRDPNAVDYLRFSLPFHRPWTLGTMRDLREATGNWLETGQRATALEVAALAGRRWLDLAAAKARHELAVARLERLDRAMAIQRKRFELGEISGSERRQVELAHASEAASLEQAAARLLTVRREVEFLVPGGLPDPEAEDLEALVGASSRATHSAGSLVAESPVLQLASTRAEVAELEAKRQQRAAWGEPEVEVEWERIPELGVVESYDSFGFRLSIPLPLGRQGHQRQLASEMTYQAANAEHDLMQQRMAVRLETALATVKGAEAALEALAPSLAEVSSTERSLSEQFRLGAISYLIYLDGFNRLDDVLRSAIEARHVLLMARLELAEITGTDAYFPLPRLESEDGS